MPLNTQIVRNGHPVPIPDGWNWWHVEAIQQACIAQCLVPRLQPSARDSAHHPPYQYWIVSAPLTIAHIWGMCDLESRDEFWLYEGDVVRAWRGA